MAAAAAAPAGDIVKAIKIVTKNLRDMRKSPDDLPPGCEIGPIDESNMLLWKCILQGPAGTGIYVSTTLICASNSQSLYCLYCILCMFLVAGTPYAGGAFEIQITFPSSYVGFICVF